MKKMRLGWTVGAALFLGCATTGSPPQQAQSAQATEAKASAAAEGQGAVAKAQPKLICDYVAETGSHFKKRVCRPAEVVEYEREESQRTIRETPRVNVQMGN